ncbi:myotubularin-related protein 9-like isoform X2 [Apostichopus japonicus]|uniref:myotubularin-related protein 9-like isoform X2 n=1 Tax=Stichopus japonicus TaxID=307972 RepID=UPI003AB41BB9
MCAIMPSAAAFDAMEFVEFIKTPKLDGVKLHQPFHPPVEGTLCVTGHHVILSSRKANTEELWLLHMMVDYLEKKFIGSTGQLTLYCKNFMVIQLDIPSMEECLNVASSIENLSSLQSVKMTYPFFYRSTFEKLEDGWLAFQPESELTRIKSDNWRLSYVNEDFEVSPTYPRAIVVPKTVDDEILKKAAAFRSGGRFPILSYLHKKHDTVIMRSSQPLTGGNSKRCREDEKLLNAALGIGRRGYIIDTRSYSSAVAAKSKGGGFEIESHYPQWRRVHKPLEKHSTLQESLTKLLEACKDSNRTTDKWLSRLSSCGWLGHVKELLNVACLVAQCIDRENFSVLVHGTDGFDVTPQVTSLAQVILDPDCRTIRGFEALVEREWLQGGHPFASRCSQSVFYSGKTKHVGPVFLLFLDCVWQIHQQFSCSFEFNEDFLHMIFENAYASQFGTFLCNNEAERERLELAEKTTSLWTFVNRPDILQKYLNPLFKSNQNVIWPAVAPQSLCLWESTYLRWDIEPAPRAAVWGAILDIMQDDKESRLKVYALRRELADLQKEALEKGLIGE